MEKVELVPPGRWKRLWWSQLGPVWATALMWSPNHWAFGFEVGQRSGSILLGPLALALAALTPSTETAS